MIETDEYAKARKRAEANYGFFIHAGVYAAVMALIVVINLVTSPQQIWFVWPLIGWGFAVVLHGVRVFLLADKNLILDAMTEKELRKSSASKKFGRQP
ncbi:MAG: 2TM domain-containing protein [Rhizobiaceae bacterium]